MRPRILHVTGEGFGGGSILVKELALAAQSDGFDVDVLASDPEFVEFLQDDTSIGVIQRDLVRRQPRPGRDLWSAWQLRRLINNGRYHLIHTHTSKGGLVGRLAGWSAHTPVVIHTVHGFPFHEETRRLPLAALSGLERWAANKCHRIVTVSRFHRDWALQLGIADPDKIVAIPNGIKDGRVQTELGQGAARDALGIDHAARVILTPGRLAPQKGLEDLLSASEIIQDPTVIFLLAGEGPLRSELESTARRQLGGERIRFLGFISDVSVALKAADVVALPSIREGLSIALLEAMAAGKPIVATSIGGNLEALGGGECAEIVPPSQPKHLAVAIAGLLKNRGRATVLGDAARRRYLEEYTLDRMLSDYLELYRNPLGYLCR